MPSKLRAEREAEGSSEKVPARGRRVAPKVKEAVLQEVAAHPNIEGRGVVANIAKGWGLDPGTVRGFMKDAGAIAELRTAAAGRCLELTLRGQERLMEDFNDEGKMFETSMKDKAFAVKSTADAAVTLLEGIPKNNTVVNFGDLKMAKQMLIQYDERAKEKNTVAAA